MIKTHKLFSGLATDQAHEQNNEVMKGDGGYIGLTQDENALLKWALAEPEVVVRVISEFRVISGQQTIGKQRNNLPS